MKAHVLTVSDRVSAGTRVDTSGPAVVSALRDLEFAVTSAVVPDEEATITAALRTAIGAGVELIITTGGTGLGPRDVTPEATAAVIERPAPGLAELIRRSGSVPAAALSRGVAGTSETTLIVNLAGSLGAVRDGMAALSPVVGHAIDQLHGGDH